MFPKGLKAWARFCSVMSQGTPPKKTLAERDLLQWLRGGNWPLQVQVASYSEALARCILATFSRLIASRAYKDLLCIWNWLGVPLINDAFLKGESRAVKLLKSWLSDWSRCWLAWTTAGSSSARQEGPMVAGGRGWDWKSLIPKDNSGSLSVERSKVWPRLKAAISAKAEVWPQSGAPLIDSLELEDPLLRLRER